MTPPPFLSVLVREQARGRAVHVFGAVRPSLLGDSPHRRAPDGMEEKAFRGTAGTVSRHGKSSLPTCAGFRAVVEANSCTAV